MFITKQILISSEISMPYWRVRQTKSFLSVKQAMTMIKEGYLNSFTYAICRLFVTHLSFVDGCRTYNCVSDFGWQQ